MKTEGEMSRLGRREFLKKLPGQLVTKFWAVTKEGIAVFSSSSQEKVSDAPVVARLEVSRCHAWSGLLCQQCYLACPRRDEAIEMRDQKPVIVTRLCDGCALCVSACETVNDLAAIRLVPRADSRPSVTAKEVVS